MGNIGRYRFIFGLIVVYALIVLGVAVYFARENTPDKPKVVNQIRTVKCDNFSCIEKAVVSHGIDKAYQDKFLNRPVDCAAKIWDQGLTLICKFTD